MRRALAALAAVAFLAGCGGGHHAGTTTQQAPAPTVTTVTKPAPALPAAPGCPQAQDGHGSMGVCTPQNLIPRRPLLFITKNPTFPDRSNNDPTTNYAAVAKAGHPAVYLKVNQGTSFVDGWFLSMRGSAWAHGLAVGGYDFVSTYSTTEAFFFVSRLKLAGMTRSSARWLPPALDVEYNNATRAGVQAMVNVVRNAFGRVIIYTGSWYWTPHLGCWWPQGVPGWISGYPTAVKPCGLSSILIHQYTSTGFDGAGGAVDMNVYNGTAAQFRSFAKLSADTSPADVLTAKERKLLTAFRPNLKPAKKDAALNPLARQIRAVRTAAARKGGGGWGAEHRKTRYTLLTSDFNKWAAASFLASREKTWVYAFYGASSGVKRAQLSALSHRKQVILTLAHERGHGGWAREKRGSRYQWIAKFVSHRT